LLRSDAGYYTGICGRSYHLDGGGKGNPDLGGILEKHQLKTFDQRVDLLQAGGDMQTPKVFDEFLAKRPADKPFYMWMNFSDPHHGWTTGQELRPDPASLKLPAHWPDTPELRGELANYCGEVNHLDGLVAQAIALLEKHKVLEETIVIFTGDNGAAFPRGKGSLHEMGCGTPLIVRWPGVVKPGTESRDLISGEDFAPTLLEAAGVKVPAKVTGQSFLPLLKGEKFAARKYVFTERGPHGGGAISADMRNNVYDLARAVRNERYRLIYNATPWIGYAPVDSASQAGWQSVEKAHVEKKLPANLEAAYFTLPRPVYELYDLQEDPSELNNLYDKPTVAAVQHELLLALAEKMITDFDYLPLPDVKPAEKTEENPRAASFAKLDKNQDGKLSKEEFLSGKPNSKQEERFQLRDLDKSGHLSRQEYLPNALPEAH
jgi:N-sulfoglucosamine sulfohydrolase